MTKIPHRSSTDPQIPSMGSTALEADTMCMDHVVCPPPGPSNRTFAPAHPTSFSRDLQPNVKNTWHFEAGVAECFTCPSSPPNALLRREILSVPSKDPIYRFVLIRFLAETVGGGKNSGCEAAGFDGECETRSEASMGAKHGSEASMGAKRAQKKEIEGVGAPHASKASARGGCCLGASASEASAREVLPPAPLAQEKDSRPLRSRKRRTPARSARAREGLPPATLAQKKDSRPLRSRKRRTPARSARAREGVVRAFVHYSHLISTFTAAPVAIRTAVPTKPTRSR
jgi:hypothetical protein